MGGNASVSFFNLESGVVTPDIFQAANGFYLGDVGQSMTRIGDKIYIVVNNSGKIEVVNASDFKSVMTIQNLTSPRYLLQVGEDKAYVSDLYAKQISIINLSSGAKIGSIPLPFWTEEMVLAGGKVYVGTAEHNKVYVVDPVGDSVSDSIQVGNSPGSLKVDQEGNVWVLCYGSDLTGLKGSCYKITQPGNVSSSVFDFPSSLSYGSMLELTEEKDTLFVLATHLYRFPIAQPNFSTPFIQHGSRNYTCFGYDSSNRKLYLGDGKDFNQNGEVFIFDEAGIELDSFESGVIPGGFLFGE